jgi:signal transduction histidine kinase
MSEKSKNKKQIMRIIFTTSFAGLIIFIFLMNLFDAKTAGELVFDIIVFLLVVAFAIILVRETLHEIRALQRLSEQKSEFLSIASHQLRTPLSVVKGYLSLLKEGSFGELTKKQAETINKTYAVNEGMIRLVNDFLNLNRAEAGRLGFNFQKTDLRDIIDEATQIMQMPARNKGLQLKWVRPKEAVLVDVDRDKISHLISNLIDNAVKYTERGSVLLKIEGPYHFDNSVKVRIKDTGIGIEPEEMSEIFLVFFRTKRGKQINTQGAGLGLYIGQIIAAGHNGRLWAESEGRDKGASFLLELPLASMQITSNK